MVMHQERDVQTHIDKTITAGRKIKKSIAIALTQTENQAPTVNQTILHKKQMGMCKTVQRLTGIKNQITTKTETETIIAKTVILETITKIENQTIINRETNQTAAKIVMAETIRIVTNAKIQPQSMRL